MASMQFLDFVLGNLLLFIAGVICSYFAYVLFQVINGKIDFWKSNEILYANLSAIKLRNEKAIEIIKTSKHMIYDFNFAKPLIDRGLLFNSIEHAAKLSSEDYFQYLNLINNGDTLNHIIQFYCDQITTSGHHIHTPEQTKEVLFGIENINEIISFFQTKLIKNLPWFRRNKLY